MGMAAEGVWEYRPLGEIAPANSGKVKPRDFAEQEFHYLGLDALPSGGWLEPAPNLVQGTEVRSTCIQFDDRHVLYSKLRPYLNKVVVPSREGVASTEFVPLVPDQSLITRKFLAWYLRSPEFVEYAVRNSTGARMPRIRMPALWEAEIPLPPLDEQRRIVARIEALFERMAEVRRLHAAAEEEVDILFASVSGDIFETLCEDGQPAFRFEELVRDSRNGLYKPQSFYGSGTLIVRIDSFEAGRIRGFDKLKRLQLSQDELDKYSLEIGDILVNRVNGSLEELGKSAAVHALPEPTVFESNIMRFRVDGDRVLPEFVVAFLHSQQGRAQIQTRARAIQQFSINQRDVGSIVVPVPPLPAQRRIVDYLDGVQAQVAELKRLQTASAAEVERLDGAVLARAFRGES